MARGERPADLVLKNARVVNVFTREIVEADVAVVGDTIAGVGSYAGVAEVDCTGRHVAPGFIDAHMHIESTMTLPGTLASALLRRGTTSVIADAHELVNVLGGDALDFVLEQSEGLDLGVFLMLPSSVPATAFETSGAGDFTAAAMAPFVGRDRVLGLGEVMCYPDVLAGGRPIDDKLGLCRAGVIDGHSPGLTGADLQAYVGAGIETDHEASTWAEALEKARAGMTVLIRQGSAARNLAAIVDGLVASGVSTDRFAFCTDDKHYDDIETEGHIDHCVRAAIAHGLDPVTAIAMATLVPARTYRLRDRGAVAPGLRADLLVLSDLDAVAIDAVYAGGRPVGAHQVDRPAATAGGRGGVTENAGPRPVPERFLRTVTLPRLGASDLALRAHDVDDVIEIVPGELLTEHRRERLPQADGWFTPRDGLAKLAVVERHGHGGAVAVAALRGYGITGAALATTVAHDSHNALVAGDNDADMLAALARLQELQGGYVLVAGGQVMAEVPLPVAGLLSTQPGAEVAAQLHRLSAAAHEHGVVDGVDPAITLSFLALPVIPHLRLTDRGLFDVDAFALVER